jgi:phosphoenolpyruvate synthase/pyruvate phosphate dikinase
MTLTISFPGPEQTTLTEVGGKGYSLIRMVKAGLPVPPGAVLTTAFFEPWFDQIKASATWPALAEATPDKWATLCSELKGLCLALPLTGTQRQALEGLRKNLAVLGDNVQFAIRSSSPEEDLASASFAGGYETRLGVHPAELEDAVRYCFAASLDERVLVYKQEHGFDVMSPRIAVVVQQQIDSEVAGVGFSLNPLTNDYDEAVINANWGLGESVVAGIVSPDYYIVNKFSRQIIEKKLGTKQVSIWLGPDGGTIERKGHRSAEFTLSDSQLGELTEMFCRIEALYDKPMDIEWTYCDGQLYVLQARPITRYLPLAAEMVTRPGERRRLYADAALSKGMTLNAPISPMGLSWMEDFMVSFFEKIQLNTNPMKGLLFAAGGRMYMNLSNVMWLVNPKVLSKSSTANDAVLAEILANIDEKQYRPITRPPWIRLRMLWLIPRILWWLRGFFKNTLYAMLSPERAYQTYRLKVNICEKKLSEKINFSLSLKEFQQTYFAPVIRDMFNVTMAALTASLVALGTIDRVIGKKIAKEKDLVDKLKRGFTGNVVVEMGIMLFRLAKLLDRSDLADLNRLADRVDNRRMSAEFLDKWDNFLSRYGCRGPMEMDPASPRYGDDPRLALRQISFMSVDDEDFNPEAAHRRQVEERRRAYEELKSRLGWFRRILLQRIHRIIELFAGTRDTPKYHIVLYNYAFRQRVLIEGQHLVREGRLDSAEDVFDLTFHDLEAAANNPSMDLLKVREERTRFLKILRTQVTEFPNVIDSRGRILRPPPRKEKAGEMSGMAISPGVVTGAVKVLRNPYEKSVNKGDVLVAYTTDPGWTPLFVNAAAVLLEVGGVLQHGAVIAREYGKPCVAGIDGLMTKLNDGQRVEVDGTAGVVRLLP